MKEFAALYIVQSLCNHSTLLGNWLAVEALRSKIMGTGVQTGYKKRCLTSTADCHCINVATNQYWTTRLQLVTPDFQSMS